MLFNGEFAFIYYSYDFLSAKYKDSARVIIEMTVE
jgi:hypothetical protein